jgi:hypothetical protein
MRKLIYQDRIPLHLKTVLKVAHTTFGEAEAYTVQGQQSLISNLCKALLAEVGPVRLTTATDRASARLRR